MKVQTPFVLNISNAHNEMQIFARYFTDENVTANLAELLEFKSVGIDSIWTPGVHVSG